METRLKSAIVIAGMAEQLITYLLRDFPRRGRFPRYFRPRVFPHCRSSREVVPELAIRTCDRVSRYKMLTFVFQVEIPDVSNRCFNFVI